MQGGGANPRLFSEGETGIYLLDTSLLDVVIWQRISTRIVLHHPRQVFLC